MTVRTVNNLPAATHGETVRCLFVIELSKQSWVIGFNTPLSEKISRRTLSGCDWKEALPEMTLSTTLALAAIPVLLEPFTRIPLPLFSNRTRLTKTLAEPDPPWSI